MPGFSLRRSVIPWFRRFDVQTFRRSDRLFFAPDVQTFKRSDFQTFRRSSMVIHAGGAHKSAMARERIDVEGRGLRGTVRVGRTCRTKSIISMAAVLASERVYPKQCAHDFFDLAPFVRPAYPVTVASWTDSLFGGVFKTHKATFTWPVNDRAWLAPGGT